MVRHRGMACGMHCRVLASRAASTSRTYCRLYVIVLGEDERRVLLSMFELEFVACPWLECVCCSVCCPLLSLVMHEMLEIWEW